MIKQDLTFTNLDSLDLDNILVRVQLDIVTQSDDRHYSTKLKCDLSSDHDYTVKQITTLIHISKGDDAIPKFQLNRIYLQQTVDIFRLPDLLCCDLLLVYLILNPGCFNLSGDHTATDNEYQSKSQEDQCRERSHDTKGTDNDPYYI